MLSLEECLDFCDLEHEEIEAIAEHEHVHVIVAAEMGCELLKTSAGIHDIEVMFLENLERARDKGQVERADRLMKMYKHFHSAHPTL